MIFNVFVAASLILTLIGVRAAIRQGIGNRNFIQEVNEFYPRIAEVSSLAEGGR